MSKKQIKTNHSQGQSGGDAILFNNVGHREIVQSSSPPADEQELKEELFIKAGFEKGFKFGEAIREDEIIKIIKRNRFGITEFLEIPFKLFPH